MKRAFTLLEMLIVIATIAILIGIIFRVGNIAAQYAARNVTIDRLQRLENALSGYYAAYGTYPPVKYHNLPDIYLPVSESGVQLSDGTRNSSIDQAQVKAACAAQPVGCYFPFSSGNEKRIHRYSERLKKYAQKHRDELSPEKYAQIMAGFDIGSPTARFSNYKDEEDWREIQLFKFGLMSYLLPRYLIMMRGAGDFVTYQQWVGNNEMPANPLSGRKDLNWNALENLAEDYSKNPSTLNALSYVSSQSVCVRWIANFANSLTCSGGDYSYYGVSLQGGLETDWTGDRINDAHPNLDITIYTPGNQGGTSGQYILDSITIHDGWGREFFYYSPPPYQSYIVWSAGPNGATFPKWVDHTQMGISATDQDLINGWIEDDIVGMRK